MSPSRCATDTNRVYANARFLQLREPVEEDGASKFRPCRTEASAEAAVRRMVDTFVRAFDKTGIDMTVFKPNHFATLCVYYLMFFAQEQHETAKRTCALVLRDQGLHSRGQD